MYVCRGCVRWGAADIAVKTFVLMKVRKRGGRKRQKMQCFLRRENEEVREPEEPRVAVVHVTCVCVYDRN